MRKLIMAVLLVCPTLTTTGVSGADGCGAGLYRDSHGRCHFYRAVKPQGHSCEVGFIWRNGRCRQNVENDPFVSTWPNAPR